MGFATKLLWTYSKTPSDPSKVLVVLRWVYNNLMVNTKKSIDKMNGNNKIKAVINFLSDFLSDSSSFSTTGSAYLYYDLTTDYYPKFYPLLPRFLP